MPFLKNSRFCPCPSAVPQQGFGESALDLAVGRQVFLQSDVQVPGKVQVGRQLLFEAVQAHGILHGGLFTLLQPN